MTQYWGQNITIEGAGMNFLPASYPGSGLNDPNIAQQYESDIVNALQTITGNGLGNLVVWSICNSPQRLLIAGPDQGDTVGGNTGTFSSHITNDYPGASWDIAIWYDPHDWLNPNGWPASAAQLASNVDPAQHFQYDDVLFHELVHCLRMMRGIWQGTVPVDSFPGPGGQWDNVEEFFAIILTNIYLSMKGRSVDLRGGHRFPWQPLDTDPNTNLPVTDSEFYNWYENIIDALFQKTSDVCGPASSIGCGWNPLHFSWVSQQNAQNLNYRVTPGDRILNPLGN
jgi:hypothetical protein